MRRRSCFTTPVLLHLTWPVLKIKHADRKNYIYRILFNYAANNDIQIYWYTTSFFYFACMCVSECKESSETTESWMEILCDRALDWLSRQREHEGTGRVSGRTHTHTHINLMNRWADVFLCQNTLCQGSWLRSWQFMDRYDLLSVNLKASWLKEMTKNGEKLCLPSSHHGNRCGGKILLSEKTDTLTWHEPNATNWEAATGLITFLLNRFKTPFSRSFSPSIQQQTTRTDVK